MTTRRSSPLWLPVGAVPVRAGTAPVFCPGAPCSQKIGMTPKVFTEPVLRVASRANLDRGRSLPGQSRYLPVLLCSSTSTGGGISIPLVFKAEIAFAWDSATSGGPKTNRLPRIKLPAPSRDAEIGSRRRSHWSSQWTSYNVHLRGRRHGGPIPPAASRRVLAVNGSKPLTK